MHRHPCITLYYFLDGSDFLVRIFIKWYAFIMTKTASTILLIEDEPQQQDSLKTVFMREGFRVEIA